MTQNTDHIESAEKQICAILADLEKRTNSLVKSIEVVDLDVTTFKDARPQIIRRVRIEIERTPGSRWVTS